MHKPTATHWKVAKRLLRYLKQTIFHGIHIRKSSSSTITTYTDVGLAENYDYRSLTSTYIYFLGPNLISWSLEKQWAIARSSTEAEYRALANAAFETIWLLTLFQKLGLPISSPPKKGTKSGTYLFLISFLHGINDNNSRNRHPSKIMFYETFHGRQCQHF